MTLLNSLVVSAAFVVAAGAVAPAFAQQASPAVKPAATPPTAQPRVAMPSAAPSDYVIGPEDVLQVSVWKNETLSRVVPVRPDGKISLPLLHDVQASGLTAMQLLRRGGLRPGMRVLVYGASGSVGTFAVQLARAGRAHVTAVSSARNADLVRSLGADEVIDYTREDLTEGGRTYDLVLDAVGKVSSRRCRPILAEDGSFVSVRSALPTSRPEDLRTMMDLLASGMVTSVIDRRYTLAEIRDAHRYVDEGHKRGNVVIVVA